MIKSIQELKVGAWVVRETDTEAHCQNPADILRFWKDCVEKCSWYQPDKEAIVVFLLDNKGNVKGYNLVSLGLIDQSLAHAREVFRAAVVGAAKSIVIAHNHPSGDPAPSEDDIRLTGKLIESGKILGIPVQDHVIIGIGAKYFSMRESGLKDFS